MSRIDIAMFLSGLTIGCAASWLFCRKRYARIAQEEIDSVKETYSRRKAANMSSDTAEKASKTESVCEDVSMQQTNRDIISKNGYTNYAELGNEKEEKPVTEKPYVISPDEFGSIDNYDKLSLTYYTDGILADENDEKIDNADEIVGNDFDSHFGEYEDDSVFIRNDHLESDYEILKDYRRWEDK